MARWLDEKALRVLDVALADDGKSLIIEVADLQPIWCMKIRYRLRSVTGSPVVGVIHNTIYPLAQ